MLASCSVYMAAKKPEKKNLNVLRIGNSRDAVVGELGVPDKSGKNDEGLLVETWSFKQGEHKATKIVRAASHGVLDVATLGLWEVIGTPLEGAIEQDKKTYISWDN